MIGRLASVLLLSMPLASCGGDKARELAACEVETIRLYPRDTDNSGDDNVRRFDFRTACMKAKGYTFVIFVSGCSFAGEFSQQVACYKSDGLISGLFGE